MALVSLVISVVLLLVCLVVFESASSPISTSSAALSAAMQSSSPLALDILFFTIAYSSLCLTGLILLLSYLEIHPISGLTLLSLTTLCVSLNNLLKLAFSEPRPYWAYDRVSAIACDSGWGTPSGHAMLTGTIWGWLVGYLWRSRGRVRAIPLVLGILLIGLDRVYLGVHYYSQVVLGWSFAMVLVASAGAGFRLLQSGLAKMSGKWLFWSHFLAVFVYSLLVVLYFTVEPDWDEEWSRRIQSKCGVRMTAEKAAAPELVEGTAIFGLPGAFVGYKMLQRSGLKEWWGGRLSFKRIFRLLLGLLPIIFFYLIRWAALFLTSPEGSAALTVLASYLSGLFMTYGVPMLSHKFRLNREPAEVLQVSLQLIETKPMTLADLITELE